MPSVPTRKDTRGFFGRCWIGAYFWPRHSLRQPLSPRRTPPKILTVPWGRCTNPCRSFLLILRFKPKVGEIGKHTSELQSPDHLVCRLLLEKKKKKKTKQQTTQKTKTQTARRALRP